MEGSWIAAIVLLVLGGGAACAVYEVLVRRFAPQRTGRVKMGEVPVGDRPRTACGDPGAREGTGNARLRADEWSGTAQRRAASGGIALAFGRPHPWARWRMARARSRVRRPGAFPRGGHEARRALAAHDACRRRRVPCRDSPGWVEHRARDVARAAHRGRDRMRRVGGRRGGGRRRSRRSFPTPWSCWASR